MYKIIFTTILSCLQLFSFPQADSLLHKFIVSDDIAQISTKIKGPKLTIPEATVIITNTNFSCDPAACSVLPVQFLSFDAKRVSNTLVEVTWKTTNEKNNKLFIIERSFGNTTAFTEAGSVEADHSPAAIHEYKVNDDNDYEETTYYRLRKIDQNNEFSYSKIVSVKGYPARESIAVYPNPASTHVSLQVQLKKPSKVTISLFTNEGQKVYEQNRFCISGTNLYKIAVGDFKKGVYIFKVSKNDGLVLTKKFIRN